MLSLHDSASREEALRLPLASNLRDLLTIHLLQAERNGLLDLTHILAIQPGDTEKAIIEELGWSPLADPISGARFGAEDFAPYWDWLRDANGWFEMIVTIGDSGFAAILLIEDAQETLPDLHTLCRTSSREGKA
jgi:hypothetical protein